MENIKYKYYMHLSHKYITILFQIFNTPVSSGKISKKLNYKNAIDKCTNFITTVPHMYIHYCHDF